MGNRKKIDSLWLVPTGLSWRQWNFFLCWIGAITRSDADTVERTNVFHITQTGYLGPMRRISFFHTELQFRSRKKTVTRRLDWKTLKAGERLVGIRKGMGLKKGEKQVVLGTIEVVDVRRERLDAITQDDCRKEGFPHLIPVSFVRMFCEHIGTGCCPGTEITRIEFKYVD